MSTLIRFCLVLCGLSAALADEETPIPVSTLAPHIREGHADAFALDYQMRPQDVSPDKRFGVIHAGPIDPDRARNYVVALKPFSILAANEGYSYYDPGNHRKMAVQWARDSSVVLVMVGDKWGTVGATIFELRDARVTRRTDFMKAITGLLAPKFPKGKAEPFNNALLFLLDGEEKFDLSEDGRQIRLDVSATNNPNLAPRATWRGTLKAVWSVPAARWLEPKVSSELTPASRD